MRRRETAWAKASLDLPFLVKQPQADTRQPASAAVGVAASKQPKPESKSSNKSQIGDIYIGHVAAIIASDQLVTVLCEEKIFMIFKFSYLRFFWHILA